MPADRSTFTVLVTLPLFLLYSASAFAAAALILLRPMPPPAAAGTHASSSPRLLCLGEVRLGADPGATAAGLLRGLRVGGIAGLFLLAFGTGCDNARTFAGAFAMCAPAGTALPHCLCRTAALPVSWLAPAAAALPDVFSPTAYTRRSVPSGVFDLRNSTDAQQLIAEQGGVIDANYLLSWFCFGTHEIFGGVFVLPGLYLWAVAASLPPTRPLPPCLARLAPVLEQCRDGTAIACCGVSLCTFAVIKGALGFAQHTATARLLLEWNGVLGVWSWGSGDENPDGLFGVFLSSGVWVVVGLLLLVWRGNRWFLAVQLAALVGKKHTAPVFAMLFYS
jgi:hypothetical protein